MPLIAVACAWAWAWAWLGANPAPSAARPRAPAHLEGIILYSDAEWRQLFVMAGSETLLVEPAADVALPAAGRRAEVVGLRDRVRGLPAVTDARLRDLGAASPPDAPETPALGTKGERLRWVSLTALVRRTDAGDGRLVLRLAAGGRPLEAHLAVLPSSAEGPPEVGSELRLRGVLEPATGPWSLPRLWLPAPTAIEVIAPAPAWSALPTLTVGQAITRWRSGTAGGEVRLRLRAVEQRSTRSFVLEDATGRLTVEMGLPAVVSEGTSCDVRGFMEGGPGTPRLVDARWQLHDPAALDSRPEAGLPRLASVTAVRALPRAEAARGYPVGLRAVVSYSEPSRNRLFVQDEGAGLFVNLDYRDAGVRAGDHVIVEGVTAPGALAPLVLASRLVTLGRGPLPAAQPSSLVRLDTGVDDCRRVEVAAGVRSIRRVGERSEVALAAEGRRLRVLVPLATRAQLDASLVGGRLLVRGVCATRFNWRGQLEGAELYVARAEDLVVLERPPVSAWDLPRRTIRDLSRREEHLDAEGRVRVAGVLLHHRAGQPLYLRDATGTVVVETRSARPLTPGDRVEAVGFTAAGAVAPRLEDAVVRLSGHGEAPPPVRAGVGQLLGGGLDGELVRIEARLLDTVASLEGARLLLQADEVVVEATGDGELPAGPDLEPGSRLAVTGVLQVQREPAAELLVRVRLRGPADVELLSRPPWWTPGRAVWAVAGLAAVLLAAFAWVRTLRRQVRRQTADLARLAVAVEQAAEAIVLTDPDGLILYVNPAFERITGYTAAEALGSTTRLLKSGVHDRAFYAELWNTIRSGKTWEGRLTNRRKDGEFFVEDASISPIREGASGRLIGYVAVKRDVTRQVQIETHLAQTQKMEAIGRLAAGVAHDFNNVLAAIVGFADLSLRRVGDDSALLPYLTGIRDAALRAAGLTRQILTFSRQASPELGPLELRPVVEEAVRLLRALLPANVEIRSRLESRAVVAADPTQIHQVVLNLGTNGGLAMRERGGLLEIALSDHELDADFVRRHPPAKPGRYVRLQVRDGGSGMSPDVVERVFEPFFTTRGHGEGTGMGLAVVHGIVDRHGGWIRAESPPGQGATFTVYLPVVAASGAAGDAPERPLPRGDERVLLVDDEPALARVGEEMLSELGYRVTAFTSPAAALERFSSDPSLFDLAIVDLSMPGLSGDSLARELLRLRPIPIVICTGYSERFSEPDAAALGVAAFVMKPMSMHDLAHTARAALDRR